MRTRVNFYFYFCYSFSFAVYLHLDFIRLILERNNLITNNPNVQTQWKHKTND